MHTLVQLKHSHCLDKNSVCSSGPYPCPPCKSLLRECVCMCAQSESWNRVDNTHPLLQGPEEREEKGTTTGPQWAK